MGLWSKTAAKLLKIYHSTKNKADYFPWCVKKIDAYRNLFPVNVSKKRECAIFDTLPLLIILIRMITPRSKLR